MKAASRKSKNPRKVLIDKVDRLFSKYIRQRDANEGGWITCCTCGKQLPWEESHAGHWIKRGHAATRWHPANVYAQCPGDNLYKNGLQDEMALHIIKRHGPEMIDELMKLKHTPKRWSVSELRELIEIYGAK
jgi:hypothetical protein